MTVATNNELLGVAVGRELATAAGSAYTTTAETVAVVVGGKLVLTFDLSGKDASFLGSGVEASSSQFRFSIVRDGTPSGTSYNPNDFNLNDVYFLDNGESDPDKNVAVTQTSEISGGTEIFSVTFNGTTRGTGTNFYIEKRISGPFIMAAGHKYSFVAENTGSDGDFEFTTTYIDRV